MKRTSAFLTLALAATTPLAFTGCGDKTGNSTKTQKQENGKDDHPTEGPHGGSLVELGEHEYHAEFLFDEKSETVTIHILDQSAKEALPIDAKEVTINLLHNGEPEQFQLPAAPEEADAGGKSSRFQLKDDDLAHNLEHEDADPKLTVMISGKSYTGKISHMGAHAHEDEKPHKH